MRLVPALATLSFLVACTPEVSIGSRCASRSDCPDDLVCALGRCRTECLEQRDCPLGASCVLQGEGGTCSLADDACARSEDCGEPLACVDRACVNLCERVEECPPGSACEPIGDGRARCVRLPDGTDAPAPFDAGASDAGEGCRAPDCDPVVQVAVGYEHVCARTEGGAVWCWGQLPGSGGGDLLGEDCSGAPCRTTPARQWLRNPDDTTALITEATDLTVGEDFSCALFGERAWCWGLVSFGTGSTDVRFAHRVRTEAAGAPLGATSAITSSRRVAFALMDDATLSAWGNDDEGGLVDMVPANHEEARALVPTGLTDVTALVAGGYHVCMLRAGVPHCWGHNTLGQLGRDAPPPDAGAIDVVPAPVNGITGATAISAGLDHTCVLVGPDAFCWGKRALLGVFTFPGPNDCSSSGAMCSTAPVRVYRDAGSPPFVELGAEGAAMHECARDLAGDVWCWGSPESGYGDEPRRVPGLPGPVSEIAVGRFVSCAVVDGEVYCWGDNQFGQLGRGTFDARDMTPGRVLLPR